MVPPFGATWPAYTVSEPPQIPDDNFLETGRVAETVHRPVEWVRLPEYADCERKVASARAAPGVARVVVDAPPLDATLAVEALPDEEELVVRSLFVAIRVTLVGWAAPKMSRLAAGRSQEAPVAT